MVAMGKGGGKTPERVVALIKSEVAKLGQNGTARAIGIPLYSVQKYMAGVSEPTKASLEKLADYFKVSVEYLRGDTPYFLDGIAILEGLRFERGDAIVTTSRGEVRLNATLVYNAGLEMILPCLEGETDGQLLERFQSFTRSMKTKLATMLEEASKSPQQTEKPG
jgi:transcriptional regulator with XRE-family HTH domain